jgi:hypothetical protein
VEGVFRSDEGRLREARSGSVRNSVCGTALIR